MNTNRGGKRPGAGRPRKEATITLTFRVPVRWAEEIKNQVKSIIQNLKSK